MTIHAVNSAWSIFGQWRKSGIECYLSPVAMSKFKVTILKSCLWIWENVFAFQSHPWRVGKKLSPQNCCYLNRSHEKYAQVKEAKNAVFWLKKGPLLSLSWPPCCQVFLLVVLLSSSLQLLRFPFRWSVSPLFLLLILTFLVFLARLQLFLSSPLSSLHLHAHFSDLVYLLARLPE